MNTLVWFGELLLEVLKFALGIVYFTIVSVLLVLYWIVGQPVVFHKEKRKIGKLRWFKYTKID